MAYINGKEILFSLNGTYTNFKDENDFLKSIVENTISGEVVLPSGFKLGAYGLSNRYYITKLTVPADMAGIGAYAFMECTRLTELDWHYKYSVGGGLYKCKALETIRFHNRIEFVGNDCYASCSALENLIFYSTCKVYNNNSCSFTSCPLTVESMLNLFNALEDNTGGTQYTVRLGATNLAKLTDEQQMIALNKNIALV